MGTVWMAQQTEPVKRPVAVKLIKLGMDSKQVLTRFESKRNSPPDLFRVVPAELLTFRCREMGAVVRCCRPCGVSLERGVAGCRLRRSGKLWSDRSAFWSLPVRLSPTGRHLPRLKGTNYRASKGVAPSKRAVS
jgi:hypothetical protein